jgi:hypothetical protein
MCKCFLLFLSLFSPVLVRFHHGGSVSSSSCISSMFVSFDLFSFLSLPFNRYILLVRRRCNMEIEYKVANSRSSIFFEQFLVQSLKASSSNSNLDEHDLKEWLRESDHWGEEIAHDGYRPSIEPDEESVLNISEKTDIITGKVRDIDVRIIFVPPTDKAVLTAAVGPNLASLLGGVTGEIEIALCFDRVDWKQQFMTSGTFAYKVVMHFVMSLFFQIPVKILPFTAGITDISNDLKRGDVVKSLKRAGNMGSNAVFGSASQLPIHRSFTFCHVECSERFFPTL